MSEETSLKHSSYKKKAKFALGKSVGLSKDRFKTLGFKKKGIRNIRVKGDDDMSNGGDGFSKRRNEDDDGKGRGLKSGFRGRREGGVKGDESNGFKKKRMYGNDAGSKFGKNDARGDRRAKSEDGESRDGFLRKNGDARYDNGKNNRKFSKSESQDARSDRRMKSGNGESRDGFLRKSGYERDETGKSRMFDKRESHDARGDRRMKSENGESRNEFLRKNGDSKYENSKTVNKWEIQDARGDRRNKSENGENRNGFLGKNEDARYENSKQIRSFAEEQKFGRKKLKSKKDVPDDSMATFDRPRRRRRLIRIAYPYDTANKRFDDNLPTIDNTTEQKKDSDTEENVEISQNARFRAIQPSPSIISFVNENLLGRRREIEFKRAGYNIELSSPLDNIPFSTSSERERIEESVSLQ